MINNSVNGHGGVSLKYKYKNDYLTSHTFKTEVHTKLVIELIATFSMNIN